MCLGESGGVHGVREGTSPPPWKVEGSAPDSLSREHLFSTQIFRDAAGEDSGLELSLAVLPRKGELKIPDYCILEQPDKGAAQKPPLKPDVPVKAVDKNKTSPQNYCQKCASVSHLDAEGGSPGWVWQGYSRKLHSHASNIVLSSQRRFPPPEWTWSRMELPLLG